MITLLSKVCVHLLCGKCSLSSQLLIPYVNMWASRSLDWRKIQFLLAISAIKVLYGLKVLTRGIRSVDTLFSGL